MAELAESGSGGTAVELMSDLVEIAGEAHPGLVREAA
jgi:hypothetical protein